MSPQLQFELASMLTALYSVTMIHQLFQGRICGQTQFGQTLKLQSAVVTMNIRTRSLKSN